MGDPGRPRIGGKKSEGLSLVMIPSPNLMRLNWCSVSSLIDTLLKKVLAFLLSLISSIYFNFRLSTLLSLFVLVFFLCAIVWFSSKLVIEFIFFS